MVAVDCTCYLFSKDCKEMAAVVRCCLSLDTGSVFSMLCIQLRITVLVKCFNIIRICSLTFVFVYSVLGHARSKSQRTWNQTGIGMYVICALPFWYFHPLNLCTLCSSSVTLSILQERIRTYMNKVKEITDKRKAGRLDKGAAARFVRNALYEPNEKDPRKKAAAKKAADTTPDTTQSKRPKQSWSKRQYSCTDRSHCIFGPLFGGQQTLFLDSFMEESYKATWDYTEVFIWVAHQSISLSRLTAIQDFAEDFYGDWWSFNAVIYL